MTSRFMYVVARVRMSFVFQPEFHSSVCIQPHLVYPLIHQWTVGLLAPFAIEVNADLKKGIPISVPVPAFNVLGVYTDVELVDHRLILC